ncbi:TetR/AcrR family transcriptional regulator [Sporolactobacillus terrae]|uniref:TetR family transcriptional regulator n=1 Tax=Sporolactobacillus terrae TaxID=269673 RepID=A0A5K7X111_9BACL|nr:TetR/AcrR family transcriptional regulator [Sporolactobacillus terrae]BBN97746.1 TetR family transcriptional regulator [Sporolactobacillus terrae]
MRRGLTRQHIIEQAAKQVEEEGLQNLTLTELAEQLQIQTPSLYNHIKNMHDLKNGLASFSLAQFAEVLIQSVIGKARDDALFAIADAYRAFVKAHPNLYRAIIEVPDPFDPDFQNISDRLLSFLFKILEGYALSEEDRVHAVRGLRSIIHGFISLQLHHGFNMNDDQEESLTWILSAYLHGLKAKMK